eukprot:COSAG01_NODE_6806_length_3488_cov_26.281499_4_plen_221_part_00
MRRFQQRIHNFLYIEESTLSRVYVGGVSGLIVLNILSVFVESWDEERVNYWGRDQRIPQQAYDVFEACSVAVFTLDYILRLYSAARADSSVAVRRTVTCAYLTATRDPTSPPPHTHIHTHSLFLSLAAFVLMCTQPAPIRVDRDSARPSVTPSPFLEFWTSSQSYPSTLSRFCPLQTYLSTLHRSVCSVFSGCSKLICQVWTCAPPRESLARRCPAVATH